MRAAGAAGWVLSNPGLAKRIPGAPKRSDHLVRPCWRDFGGIARALRNFFQQGDDEGTDLIETIQRLIGGVVVLVGVCSRTSRAIL